MLISDRGRCLLMFTHEESLRPMADFDNTEAAVPSLVSTERQSSRLL